MGDVVPIRRKSLVEFEQNAAKLVAVSSRFMADVPALMRFADLTKDDDLAERVCALIIPLSALVESVGVLEEYAPAISEAVPHNEPVIVHVENISEAHNVRCHAEVRENVVHVRKFELLQRPWIDRLTRAQPTLLIEYIPTAANDRD